MSDFAIALESPALRTITSGVAMLVTLSWWISQPIAAGKVLHAYTGLPVELGIVVAGLVVVVYTMTGGIIAVAYTDLAQLGLMVLGMVVLLPLAWYEAGGWSAISAAVPAQNLTPWAPGKTVVWGWILAVLPGQMVLQVYHQRIFAALLFSVVPALKSWLAPAPSIVAGLVTSLVTLITVSLLTSPRR